MSYSFQVIKGRLHNVRYDGGMFDCSHRDIISLKGCPKYVDGNIFDCSGTSITNLKYCPRKVVGGYFFCELNSDLIDISDLPSSCLWIDIEDCPNIIKFPKKIDNTLCFYKLTDEVRKRIKEQKFYEILCEKEDHITVCQKKIGVQVLDRL